MTFFLVLNVLKQFKSVNQSGYTYQCNGLRGSNVVHANNIDENMQHHNNYHGYYHCWGKISANQPEGI